MVSPSRAVLIAVVVVGLALPGTGLAVPAPDPVARAPAAAAPRVAVVVVALDPLALLRAGALEHAAEAAAARSTRLRLVPARQALNPRSTQARADALLTARALVQEGLQYLDELDSVKATRAFERALEQYGQADSTAAFAERLEACVLEAGGHATGGENAAAKRGLEAAIALDPEARVSPALFPPELIRHAEAQRRLAAAATGELTVRTAPAGAAVWVDGAWRGLSPVTVKGLSSGRHVVAAALGGYQFAQVELLPGDVELPLQPAELALEHQQALRLVQGDAGGPGRDRAALRLAQAMGVEQVVLVLAKKSTTGEQLELTALRLEARDGHTAAAQAATLDARQGPALDPFFDLLFAADAPRDGKRPVTHAAARGASPRTVAALTLVGAGVAAAIGGGVFGLLANSRANEFQQTTQTKVARSALLKAEGQTFALVADISFLVAIAAAATGGALLLTAPPAPEGAPPPQLPPSGEGRASGEPAQQPARQHEDHDDLRNY